MLPSLSEARWHGLSVAEQPSPLAEDTIPNLDRIPAKSRFLCVARLRVPVATGLSAKRVQSRSYHPHFVCGISEQWSLGPMFGSHDLLLPWGPRPLQYTFSLTARNRARSVSFQTRTATPSTICS